MEWLNLKTSVLHAAEYIGCDPRARATWLNVCLWSAQQENGGRIVGATKWKCRQWQQTCGVTRREALAAAPLLMVEGDDVLVWNYPVDKEKEVRAKRQSGRDAAAKRWADGDGSPIGSPTASPSSSPIESPNGSADTEGNRKGKEGEGNDPDSSETAQPPSPSDPVVLVFPVIGSPSEWPLHESKLVEYRATFLGVAVDNEIRIARQWCADNPKHRKTFKGMTRFLFAWLERKQNRGRPADPGKTSEFSGAF